MRETTLANLRSRVRVKADIQGYTDRHPTSELDQYINNSWRKLYGKLATAHLLKNTVTQVITGSGATQYTLPDDFFAMYGVFEEDNDLHRQLRTHDAGKRPFGRPGPKGPAVTYALQERDGDYYIEFLPQPTDGTYVYVYVPEPATLTAETDTIKGALHYDEYVVIDAAIQALTKDDLPVDTLMVQLMQLEKEIHDAQAARDLLESVHIRDVRGSSWGMYDADDGAYPYRAAPGWWPGRF